MERDISKKEYDRARKLLQFYFKNAFQGAGMEYGTINSAEIANIISSIEAAVQFQIEREIKKLMQPPA